MKIITYIFTLLFSVSVLLPTSHTFFNGKKIIAENTDCGSGNNPFSEDNSNSQDIPPAEENSGSNETPGNSEISDYLKDFFSESPFLNLGAYFSSSSFLFVKDSLLFSYFDIVIPPPEL